MAAVLLQDNAPIGYFSKAFAKTQYKWAAFTKEAYVVYAAVLFYKVFIMGCKVKLMCDHKLLEGFLQATMKNDMVNRWAINIQEYDISFKWVETSKNLSDCLTHLVDPKLYTPLPSEPTAETGFRCCAHRCHTDDATSLDPTVYHRYPSFANF